MFKIRFHGRGGQGAVTAAVILGATAVSEKKFSLATPKFGVERRGAPVTAFLRIDNKKVTERYEVYNPDCIIVLNEALIETLGETEINSGLTDNGWIIINSSKSPEEFKQLGPCNIATVPATEIALKYGIGTKTNPIVNTTILGAIIKVLGLVSLDSLAVIIAEEISAKPEENIKAAREAYEKTIVKERK